MKLVIATILALFTAVMSQRINTKVYVQRSGADGNGVFMEYVTYLKESGNGNVESSVDRRSVPESRIFSPPGFLIADRTFTGIPTTMNITVVEDDFGTGSDDGICHMVVSAKFSSTPTTVKCVREEANGRQVSNIIFAEIKTV